MNLSHSILSWTLQEFTSSQGLFYFFFSLIYSQFIFWQDFFYLFVRSQREVWMISIAKLSCILNTSLQTEKSTDKVLNNCMPWTGLILPLCDGWHVCELELFYWEGKPEAKSPRIKLWVLLIREFTQPYKTNHTKWSILSGLKNTSLHSRIKLFSFEVRVFQ